MTTRDQPAERIVADDKLRWIAAISRSDVLQRPDEQPLYLWRRNHDQPGFAKIRSDVPSGERTGFWPSVLAAGSRADGQIAVAAGRTLLGYGPSNGDPTAIKGFDLIGQTAAALGNDTKGLLFAYGTTNRKILAYLLAARDEEPKLFANVTNPASCARDPVAALARTFGRPGISAVVLWKMASKPMLAALENGTCLYVHDLSIDTTVDKKDLNSDNTVVSKWELSIPVNDISLAASVSSEARSGRGPRLAAGTLQGSVYLWEDITQRIPEELRSIGQPTFITRIAFADEPEWLQDYLFVVDVKGALTLWSIGAGNDFEPPLLPLHNVAVSDVRLTYRDGNPDEPVLVSAGTDMSVDKGALVTKASVRTFDLGFFRFGEKNSHDLLIALCKFVRDAEQRVCDDGAY